MDTSGVSSVRVGQSLGKNSSVTSEGTQIVGILGGDSGETQVELKGVKCFTAKI